MLIMSQITATFEFCVTVSPERPLQSTKYTCSSSSFLKSYSLVNLKKVISSHLSLTVLHEAMASPTKISHPWVLKTVLFKYFFGKVQMPVFSVSCNTDDFSLGKESPLSPSSLDLGTAGTAQLPTVFPKVNMLVMGSFSSLQNSAEF